jgi:hypothetical protein
MPEDEIPVTDIPRKVTGSDPIAGRRGRAQGGVAANLGNTLKAKHQLVFDRIFEFTQVYMAANNFEYPKSHDAFMKDVVAKVLGAETLPEIPDDLEYIYVPEQPEMGLQIRLVPGSPRSKIPKPDPGKEHIYDPEILVAAGVTFPTADPGGPNGEELSPDPRERAEQLRQRAAQDAAASTTEPASEELSPNIRERAGQLNERANSRAEEHGVAPGGLAPVGGLGVDGF